MTKIKREITLPLFLVLVLLWGCGESQEAPRVAMPVVVDISGVVSVITPLGYAVSLSEARVTLMDLSFTVEGEVHTASLWERAYQILLPSAVAHPGHEQGGAVTGELRGRFVIDWLKEIGRTLGTATLVEGSYTAADFVFARATTGDGLLADDPLIGHTALLKGSASRAGREVAFTVVIDSPEDRVLVGAPCLIDVSEGTTGRLHFRFETNDPLEGDTLWDEIDFLALDTDGDGQLLIAPDIAEVEDAYNTLRRAFQSHDHYRFLHGE